MDRDARYIHDFKKIGVLQLILERNRNDVKIAVIHPVHHRSEPAARLRLLKNILLRRKTEIYQKSSAIKERIEDLHTSVALRHLEKIGKKYQNLRLVGVGFHLHRLDKRGKITPGLFDPAQKRSYEFQRFLLKSKDLHQNAVF